ncbi:LuxR family transcriptional regulator [Pseudarthrobacter sp. R1]|uniref:LuxR family transcriptional regulator n=1 Tax=Pseudarthrobacter sp. R1 TaxID=2944934 RepID=UPI00210B10DA|nr:LuxR family transcriptional regulator [Pseudarthrobacter sp. R1]MCQ6272365.1 LuxR family transcriptional regulator [Pseudarthrobacter sp. R1]
MKALLRTALAALLLLAAPALSIGAAHASMAADSAGTTVALSAASPTPSPGDTASTGPANPGTGESAQNESTRTDNTPWVIGGVILLTLIAIFIWNRRRGNKTIV